MKPSPPATPPRNPRATARRAPTPVHRPRLPQHQPADPGRPAVARHQGRPPEPPPTPQSGYRLGCVWLGGMLLLGAGSLLALVLLLGLLLRHDRLLPGLQVMDVPIGGQTRAAATEMLASRWQNRTIVLTAGSESWLATPDELGLRLDAAATVAAAHELGWSPLWLAASLRSERPLSVLPRWSFDAAAAIAALTTLAGEVAIPPKPAGVQFAAGRLSTTPAQSGRALDVTASAMRLDQSAGQTLDSGRFELVVQPVPPPAVDVDRLVAEGNAWLQRPFRFQAYDPVRDETIAIEAPPAIWGSWLTLAEADVAANRLAWTVEPQLVEAFLVAQSDRLGDHRYLAMESAVAAVQSAISAGQTDASLRTYHRQYPYTVQPGDTFASIARRAGVPYPWLQQANPAVETLWAGQVIIIPSPDLFLPLPVVENKRIVVSIGQQRLWAYENRALKWEWPVSTGIDSSPTSPGIFQVQTHELNAYASIWDLWMPHFMGIYRPVPTSDFMNGFHGFPTRGGANLLWTGNLGSPVTFGCILVSSDNARQLYEWAEQGVVVEIRP